MSALNHLLATLKVEANVFHNGQYCGVWAVDTSGSQKMTFHVVSYGHCLLEVGERVIDLHEGDAVFMPSDVKHRLGISLDTQKKVNEVESQSMEQGLENDATGLVCGHFNHHHPMFDVWLKELPEVILVRRDQTSATAKVIELILQESVSSGQSTNILLNRLSDCLFYLLLRDNLDYGTGVFAAAAHPKLSRAMDAIHADTQKKWTVDELAMLVAMSRSAFSSMFKGVVGLSPMEYITQWRMTQAYRWLSDEGISTFDAALRCGYETEASFSKAFKRVMGIGPGAARRSVA